MIFNRFCLQYAGSVFYKKIPNYLLLLRVPDFFVAAGFAAGFAAGAAPFAGVTAALLAL